MHNTGFMYRIPFSFLQNAGTVPVLYKSVLLSHEPQLRAINIDCRETVFSDIFCVWKLFNPSYFERKNSFFKETLSVMLYVAETVETGRISSSEDCMLACPKVRGLFNPTLWGFLGFEVFFCFLLFFYVSGWRRGYLGFLVKCIFWCIQTTTLLLCFGGF